MTSKQKIQHSTSSLRRSRSNSRSSSKSLEEIYHGLNQMPHRHVLVDAFVCFHAVITGTRHKSRTGRGTYPDRRVKVSPVKLLTHSLKVSEESSIHESDITTGSTDTLERSTLRTNPFEWTFIDESAWYFEIKDGSIYSRSHTGHWYDGNGDVWHPVPLDKSFELESKYRYHYRREYRKMKKEGSTDLQDDPNGEASQSLEEKREEENDHQSSEDVFIPDLVYRKKTRTDDSQQNRMSPSFRFSSDSRRLTKQDSIQSSDFKPYRIYTIDPVLGGKDVPTVSQSMGDLPQFSRPPPPMNNAHGAMSDPFLHDLRYEPGRTQTEDTLIFGVPEYRSDSSHVAVPKSSREDGHTKPIRRTANEQDHSGNYVWQDNVIYDGQSAKADVAKERRSTSTIKEDDEESSSAKEENSSSAVSPAERIRKRNPAESVLLLKRTFDELATSSSVQNQSLEMIVENPELLSKGVQKKDDPEDGILSRPDIARAPVESYVDELAEPLKEMKRNEQQDVLPNVEQDIFPNPEDNLASKNAQQDVHVKEHPASKNAQQDQHVKEHLAPKNIQHDQYAKDNLASTNAQQSQDNLASKDAQQDQNVKQNTLPNVKQDHALKNVRKDTLNDVKHKADAKTPTGSLTESVGPKFETPRKGPLFAGISSWKENPVKYTKPVTSPNDSFPNTTPKDDIRSRTLASERAPTASTDSAGNKGKTSKDSKQEPFKNIRLDVHLRNQQQDNKLHEGLVDSKGSHTSGAVKTEPHREGAHFTGITTWKENPSKLASSPKDRALKDGSRTELELAKATKPFASEEKNDSLGNAKRDSTLKSDVPDRTSSDSSDFVYYDIGVLTKKTEHSVLDPERLGTEQLPPGKNDHVYQNVDANRIAIPSVEGSPTSVGSVESMNEDLHFQNTTPKENRNELDKYINSYDPNEGVIICKAYPARVEPDLDSPVLKTTPFQNWNRVPVPYKRPDTSSSTGRSGYSPFSTTVPHEEQYLGYGSESPRDLPSPILNDDQDYEIEVDNSIDVSSDSGNYSSLTVKDVSDGSSDCINMDFPRRQIYTIPENTVPVTTVEQYFKAKTEALLDETDSSSESLVFSSDELDLDSDSDSYSNSSTPVGKHKAFVYDLEDARTKLEADETREGYIPLSDRDGSRKTKDFVTVPPGSPEAKTRKYRL